MKSFLHHIILVNPKISCPFTTAGQTFRRLRILDSKSRLLYWNSNHFFNLSMIFNLRNLLTDDAVYMHVFLSKLLIKTICRRPRLPFILSHYFTSIPVPLIQMYFIILLLFNRKLMLLLFPRLFQLLLTLLMNTEYILVSLLFSFLSTLFYFLHV